MARKRASSKHASAPAAQTDDSGIETDETSTNGGEWQPTAPGAVAGAPVEQPSLDDMIAGAAGAGAAAATEAATDAIDAVRDSLREPPAPGVDPSPAVPLGYNLDGTPKTTRRGRPSNRARVEGTAPAPRRAAPSRAGEPRETKLQLAQTIEERDAEIATLQAQLQAAQMRGDTDRVAQLSDMLAMVFDEGFGFIAEVRGDHWRLRRDESEKLGEYGAPALAPYAQKLNEHAPWVMFGVALFGVVRARLAQDKRNEQNGTAPYLRPQPVAIVSDTGSIRTPGTPA